MRSAEADETFKQHAAVLRSPDSTSQDQAAAIEYLLSLSVEWNPPEAFDGKMIQGIFGIVRDGSKPMELRIRSMRAIMGMMMVRSGNRCGLAAHVLIHHGVLELFEWCCTNATDPKLRAMTEAATHEVAWSCHNCLRALRESTILPVFANQMLHIPSLKSALDTVSFIYRAFVDDTPFQPSDEIARPLTTVLIAAIRRFPENECLVSIALGILKSMPYDARMSEPGLMTSIVNGLAPGGSRDIVRPLLGILLYIAKRGTNAQKDSMLEHPGLLPAIIRELNIDGVRYDAKDIIDIFFRGGTPSQMDRIYFCPDFVPTLIKMMNSVQESHYATGFLLRLVQCSPRHVDLLLNHGYIEEIRRRCAKDELTPVLRFVPAQSWWLLTRIFHSLVTTPRAAKLEMLLGSGALKSILRTCACHYNCGACVLLRTVIARLLVLHPEWRGFLERASDQFPLLCCTEEGAVPRRQRRVLPAVDYVILDEDE